MLFHAAGIFSIRFFVENPYHQKTNEIYFNRRESLQHSSHLCSEIVLKQTNTHSFIFFRQTHTQTHFGQKLFSFFLIPPLLLVKRLRQPGTFFFWDIMLDMPMRFPCVLIRKCPVRIPIDVQGVFLWNKSRLTIHRPCSFGQFGIWQSKRDERASCLTLDALCLWVSLLSTWLKHRGITWHRNNRPLNS